MFLGPRFDTLLIAALDASVDERMEADFLCDGVADQVTIQTAMAALPSSGGSIVLSTGTFTFSGGMLFPVNNVRLTGQGRNTLINRDASSVVMSTVGSTGTLIEELRTDGGTITIGGTVCSKHNVWEGNTFIHSSSSSGGGVTDEVVLVLGTDDQDMTTTELPNAINLNITAPYAAVNTLPAGKDVIFRWDDAGAHLFDVINDSGAMALDVIAGDSAEMTVDLYRSSDTVPRARLGRTALSFGVGGVSALDTLLTRTAVATLALTTHLVPASAGTGDIGSLTLPFNSVTVDSLFQVATAGDANAKAELDSDSLSFGPGGASALDVNIQRIGTAKMSVNNATWCWGASSLTLVNGANDDVSLASKAVFIQITGPTAAFSVRGLGDGSNSAGHFVVLYNSTAFDMTISNEAGTSTANNRILTGTGADVTLTAQSSATLFYNQSALRWILTATQG
jgi:hypothetical protein